MEDNTKKAKATRTQLIVGLVAFLLLVGVLLMPKQPASGAKGEVAEATTEEKTEEVHDHNHDHSDVDVQIDDALKMVESEAPMQGILALRQIAEDNPDNVRAKLALGKLSIRSGQWDKAVQRYEQVLKIDDKNAEALWELSGIYMQRERLDSAIMRLETLASQEIKGYEAAHLFLGRSYRTFADPLKAIESFEKYLLVSKNEAASDSVRKWIKELKKH